MLEAFSNAVSALKSFSRKLQNNANNLANVQTSGFKSGEVENVAQQTGGVRSSAATRNTRQGSVLSTSNPLDLAVSGRGFFQVRLPSGGTAFTRAGSFKVDNAGRIATAEGNPIVPEIALSGNRTAVSVGTTGEVSIETKAGRQAAGQIQLADFNNPAGLSAIGGGLFQQTAASGAPALGNPGTGRFGAVISGALEASNVDIVRETVDQIAIKTAFKANANVIKAADEMTGTILDIKG